MIKKILLWIWQLPQNIVGSILSIGSSKKEYDNIKYYVRPFFGRSITLGNYIILDPLILKFRDSYIKSLIRHKHGHQIQSMYFGPFYLILIGIPSLIRNRFDRYHLNHEWYYDQPFEKWADKLGNVEE